MRWARISSVLWVLGALNEPMYMTEGLALSRTAAQMDKTSACPGVAWAMAQCTDVAPGLFSRGLIPGEGQTNPTESGVSKYSVGVVLWAFSGGSGAGCEECGSPGGDRVGKARVVASPGVALVVHRRVGCSTATCFDPVLWCTSLLSSNID